MSLKDIWRDLENDNSFINADNINDIAHAVIDLEDEQQEAVKGENGATFIPSVSANGVISWTNDRNLPNPTPVNIKGEKGDKGDKGDKGERGLQGIQGIQGERGTKGDKGDKGDRGEQGIQGVQGIKGETGAQGQKGADGTPATHRWSGTTLYITSASGTSSANLKGDKGDTGADGKNGTNGVDGKDGKDGYTPVKGKDYFTPADKAEMVQAVLNALPNGDEVSY